MWHALTAANWDILTHGASAGPREYGALLATPPGYGIVDGDEIPYLPAAAERQRRNYENRFKDDPEVKCYMPGVPRANYMPYPLQIFHSDGRMLVAYQFAGAARIVNLGAAQPSAIDSWMGVSNAHWDGDTLVVDVTGFNGQAWLDRAGNQASPALHVVERYTLAGPDAIDYSATLEDPKTFSRPWSMHFRLCTAILIRTRISWSSSACRSPKSCCMASSISGLRSDEERNMRSCPSLSIALPLACAAALAEAQTSRTPWGDPDLQGTWSNATLTPLQRPADLKDKEFFTPEEAKAYVRQRLAAQSGDENIEKDKTVG